MQPTINLLAEMQLKKGTNDKHTLQTNQLNTLRTALPCGGSGNINNSCLKNESVQSSLQIMNSMKYHPLPIPIKKVSLHNQTQKYTIHFSLICLKENLQYEQPFMTYSVSHPHTPLSLTHENKRHTCIPSL